ncbi:MAG TPA: hypothetical protein VHO02_07750, partial [Fibrobacteria bacterium]|nr:hypothetical protein [Fibrobacteria bacterium]
QFDVFRRIYHDLSPEFATFFSNSTAHFQHHFWGDAEESVFHGASLSMAEARKSPVFCGFLEMDRLLGAFCKVIEPDTVLIMCTAISQRKVLPGEVGEPDLFRPNDLEEFARFAGITAPFKALPAMGGQFGYEFESEGAAEAALQIFRGMTLAGQSFGGVLREGRKLAYNCALDVMPEKNDLLRSAVGKSVGFSSMFSGQGSVHGVHHPDGMFWVRLPGVQGRMHAEKISLTAIAPTILRLLGRSIPQHMRHAPLDLSVR